MLDRTHRMARRKEVREAVSNMEESHPFRQKLKQVLGVNGRETLLEHVSRVEESEPRRVLFGDRGAVIVATAKQAIQGAEQAVRDVFVGVIMVAPVKPDTKLPQGLEAERPAALHLVYVAPEFRQQGLMTEMMQAVNKHVDEQNIDALCISVPNLNDGHRVEWNRVNPRPYQADFSTQRDKILMAMDQGFTLAKTGWISEDRLFVRPHSKAVEEAIRTKNFDYISPNDSYDIAWPEKDVSRHIVSDIKQERALDSI